MAIGAAHVALGDFSNQTIPIERPQKRTHCCGLFSALAVVELKDPQVRRSAIDTGMFREIPEHHRSKTLALGSVSAACFRQVLVAILPIMRLRVCTLTRPTFRRAQPRAPVLDCELTQWQRAFAG